MDYFVQKHLTRAANDKAYIRQRLSQGQAKSIRPFLKQWEKLVTAHAQDLAECQAMSEVSRWCTASGASASADCKDEVEAALINVPMPILCRIAMYALSPPLLLGSQKLDLSRLCASARESLNELDLGRLLRTFGAQADEVTRISLAHNNLTRKHETPLDAILLPHA